MTPVLVAGFKAPTVQSTPGVNATVHRDAERLLGSNTSRPPSQVIGPAPPSKLQPGGFWAMIGIDVQKRAVLGSQVGCSIESPNPEGIIVPETWTLMILVTLLGPALSPFALNSVPNGGSSALLAPNNSVPAGFNAISSNRVVPPVETDCTMPFGGKRLISITLSVLLPSPAEIQI